MDERLKKLQAAGIWVRPIPRWWHKFLPKSLRPKVVTRFIAYEIDTDTGRWVVDVPEGVTIIAHNPPLVGREAW